MTARTDTFNIPELQHITTGLLIAKKNLFDRSPIIDALLDEFSQALDKAIKELEDSFA